MQELIEQLQALATTRVPQVRLYAPELQVFGGIEARPAFSQYHWDGMKRGADVAHPYLVFQYTLSGWGAYAANNVTYQITPGMAFTALIPSEHVYYLPATAPGWNFFWLLIHHPYIVERVARRQQESGTVMTIAPNSPLMMRAVDLFTYICRPTPRDSLTHERALFEFFWEHERATYHSHDSQSEGERLLDEVRRYVMGALERPIAVDELATIHGMSRSHFSHMFKAATGLGPAHFIQQIRMEEATRRLLHTDQSVAHIAHTTGFANANHFCKVFRQRFHLSPGAFRQQMR